MRKLALLVCLLFVAAFVSANNYTVAVSTYNPTEELGQEAASYPAISGGVRVQQIIITNSGATVQTVTVYELSGSSLTATAVAVAVLETTGTLVIPYTAAERIEDIAVTKSATGSTVNVSIQYK
jgi:hypothetical protein